MSDFYRNNAGGADTGALDVGDTHSDARVVAPGDIVRRRSGLGAADGGRDPATWASWLLSAGFAPRTFLTLTFDDRQENVSPSKALWWWRFLVTALNVDAGGKRYKRKWSHSFFGYIVGVEHHKSGAVHLHALANTELPFRRIHSLWQSTCGFAWLRPVDDGDRAMRYVLKYVCKDISNAHYSIYLPRTLREWRGGSVASMPDCARYS